jgi:DNA repair exonuclease SbcCD ATPase subunit
MNIVERIGIAGIGPFKKGVTIPIEPGVSFLYGKNVLNGGNANAVGKSLLGNAIGDIFYEPEVRHDKPKSGKRIVVFRRGKSEIKVVHEAGKSERVALFVNGEDVSARTPSQTKKEALAKWGLSQEEFQTYGFVDASVPHPLVKGGTPARKAFFTSFFGLDRMDAEKKIFVKELAEIKKVKAAYVELESAFASARVDMLSRSEKEEIEERLAKLELQLKKLKRVQEKAQESQRLKTFKELASQRLKQLSKAKKEKGELRTVRQIKEELRAASSAEEQMNEYRDYQRARARYIQQSAGLDLTIPIEDLKADARAYQKAKDLIEDLADVRLPKIDLQEVSAPSVDRAELEADERRLEHKIQHSKKFAKGICDSCGQEVKAEDPRKLKLQLDKVRQELEEWRAYEDYNSKLSALKEKRKDARAKIADRESAETIAAKLKDRALLYEKRSQLVEPEKVDKPSKVFDVDALRHELELAEFAESNAEMIEALDSYVEIDFDPAELATVQEQVFSLKAKIDLHNSVKSRALQIRNRLTELREAMARQDALELIIEGYSDKAMKKMAIESISKHLMESVNRYAALVFEKYRFEFVWGTQIQILVHRPEGVSDVRKLSGAESMLFTLILILSLLIFVPKNKRLSLLILDEPYASFSDGTAELFTKLLPHITQVIPSVLIITPKSEFRVDSAAEFTAVKQHGGTILKKGHPDEI